MTITPISNSLTLADDAVSRPIGACVSVRLVVGVSLRTLLASTNACPFVINAVANRLQMFHVLAKTIAAKVVDYLTSRNRPLNQFISETMSRDTESLCRGTKGSIASSIDGSFPRPALVGGSSLYFRPESLFCRRHGLIVARAFQENKS